MPIRRGILIFLALFAGAALLAAQGADAPGTSDPDERGADSSAGKAPTGRKLMHYYVMDTAGPYPLMMAAFTAAIHQGTDNPPDWHQGAGALGKRFGSNMGITAVANTTRLGLAVALKQDTSYHRCRCNGVPARLRHAGLSALIARRWSDGRQVFSFPNLVAPYAATMTATYGWYPDRYGAKDAFRMGNYNLLGTVGSDLAFEFVPRAVWGALGHIHLNSRRLAQDE
ncbi:MAG TPA: hypothetical protein VGL22_19275 [Terracidiphilus sp.]|jgi:hypothetical protein